MAKNSDRELYESSEWVQEAQLLEAELRQLKDKFDAFQHRVRDVVARQQMSLAEFVDLAWVCNKIEDVSDELRKEAAARHKTCAHVVCFAVTKQCTEDPSLEFKAVGKLASAVPNPKIVPLLPTRGSPEYNDLLKYFGVDAEATMSKAVKFDWNKLADWLTELQANSIPCPINIKMGTEFNISMYGKRKKS